MVCHYELIRYNLVPSVWRKFRIRARMISGVFPLRPNIAKVIRKAMQTTMMLMMTTMIKNMTNEVSRYSLTCTSETRTHTGTNWNIFRWWDSPLRQNWFQQWTTHVIKICCFHFKKNSMLYLSLTHRGNNCTSKLPSLTSRLLRDLLKRV